ncbi:TPA: peptidase [Vibrio parahaemolyticus]|nr:peptidase [Vibrio parahaemolyticus]HCE3021338.1 peptidase [Vibrio parahaemolyticus]HCE4476870.1 peptidase [Vibrio parahaemolyticus]HCE4480321.1 peptidase [Vibrio parahaemolyticus]
MKAKLLATLGLILSLSLTGCANIQHYENISVNQNVSLQTSIGGSVFRLQKTKDLPNAFGGADIYGGKVNTGYSDLRFMGMSDNNEVVFRFTDVVVESNETTMSRYGSDRTYMSADAWGNVSATTYRKQDAQSTQLPPNTVEFKVPMTTKSFPIGGYNIVIEQATSYNLQYVVTK